MSVIYRLQAIKPETHRVQVSCTLSNPDPEGQLWKIPTWIPGSYLIREFAKNITTLRAENAQGEVISVKKIDKNTWRCAPCRGALTLYYEVYCWDLSVRAAHIDHTHIYFNGSSVFLMPCGQEHVRCELELYPPENPKYRHWRVATGMPRHDAPPYGFGRYSAENYDALIDYPVEISDFALHSFKLGEVQHDIVVYGKQQADLSRLAYDLRHICQTHARMFGNLPNEMSYYVFLVMALGSDQAGGLEHRNSCSLMCSRDELPKIGVNGVSDEYRKFLGLCSHEYFHLWNVKRIKPAAFLPYDLNHEVYTRQLWAFEGITSYYDDLGLLRAGRISLHSYLDLLGENATRVWRSPGRFLQSLAASSFDAWIKLYRPDGNSPNATISYYSKGALFALMLDLILRRDTDGRVCLDDLMRKLWQEYGEPLIGVPEDGLENLLREISDIDFSDFFQRYLYGTEELPVADLLADFGIKFQLRAAENADDTGGLPAKGALPRTSLGVRCKVVKDGLKIIQVIAGQPAYEAGLAANDILVAIDGLRASLKTLDKQLATYNPGQQIPVHVFRRDELFEFSVTLQAPPEDTCVFSLISPVEEHVIRRRQQWLGQ